MKRIISRILTKGKIENEVIFYLGMLGLINTFASMVFIIYRGRYAFSIMIGAMFFWYSDFRVTQLMFDKNFHGTNFEVMFTYIIAQSLICYGMHMIH